MKKIDIIAGARPNFMKIAPIIDLINKCNKLSFRLIHTGQHYDDNMSGNFFKELQIPKPDINLGVGSGTQAKQTADIMVEYEKTLIKNPSDICLVVGDVNSTMACAIVAKKMNIKVAHVEAGIRSFDLTMPEEINRLVTDSITDYFFTTSDIANSNLKKAGVNSKNIFFVGNTMIDTLLKHMPKFHKPSFFNKLKLSKKKYIVLTMHRPSNVDCEKKITRILNAIVKNVNNSPVLFPVHPRTLKIIERIKLTFDNIHFTPPMSYFEFNYMVQNSKCVITDSGGITEEATVMDVPCITLRDNTERPETITLGTNELVGSDPLKIASALKKVFSENWKKSSIPNLWDGKAADRIVNHLVDLV